MNTETPRAHLRLSLAELIDKSRGSPGTLAWLGREAELAAWTDQKKNIDI